jgi:hypothetical protein
MSGLFEDPYKYVVDTSALIDLKKEYPPTIFKGVWDNFNRMCKNFEIISAKEVYNEIKKGTDMLADWVDDHKKNFFEPSPEEMKTIGELQVKYPSWVDPLSDRPAADPFVIACAQHRKLIIVQHELYPKNLPKVAKDLGIKFIRLPELFQTEKWEF